MTLTLEQQARALWRQAAGGDIRHGRCDFCKTITMVGRLPRRRRGRRLVCLGCFDTGAGVVTAIAAPVAAVERPGRYDSGARRRAVRSGRERGCWVYIAAEELESAGRADAWPLTYRVWGTERGGVLVRLYRDEAAA